MRLLGGLLLGIGILVAGLSGLCTLVIMVGSLFSFTANSDMIMIPLVFGGPPLLVGIGLIALGRALLKPAAPQPETKPDHD